MFTAEIEIRTRARGFHELSGELAALVARSGIRAGICSLFCLHTSASLSVCENADSDVLADLERFMARLVQDGDPLFAHDAEGPDDMPAHVRSVLTQTELSLPVRDGRLALGTWQGVYLWEHRARPHQRRIAVTIYGG